MFRSNDVSLSRSAAAPLHLSSPSLQSLKTNCDGQRNSISLFYDKTRHAKCEIMDYNQTEYIYTQMEWFINVNNCQTHTQLYIILKPFTLEMSFNLKISYIQEECLHSTFPTDLLNSTRFRTKKCALESDWTAVSRVTRDQTRAVWDALLCGGLWLGLWSQSTPTKARYLTYMPSCTVCG